MKRVLIISSIILLALLVGCKKYNNKNPYFTFGQVGNEWSYQYIKINTLTEDTISNQTVTYRVTSDNGNDMFSYEQTLGVNVYNGDWLISPTEFGQSGDDVYLTCSSVIDDINVGDNLIMGVDEMIEVAGTTIPCFKVHTNQELIPDGTTLWINPDYGIVKQNSINTEEGLYFQYMLIDKNF